MNLKTYISLKKIKTFSLFIIIFLFSCVEHTFSIHISPDGNYLVKYHAHGDKKDLLDLDFPLPSGYGWSINSTINNIDAESYDYSGYKNFKYNDLFPNNFYYGDSIYSESLFQHPTKIKFKNFFFFKTYSYNSKIKSRDVKNRYPLIEDLILDPDNPPYGWYKEALIYILYQTIDLVNIDWNNKPIIENELNNWKINELEFTSDSVFLDQFEYYKNIGLDIIMQPSAPNLYNEMDSIFKSLEDELNITLDLIDDTFLYKLTLPGIIQNTNADSISNDTLFWSFSLKDYMSEDFKMFANTKVSYSKRQKIGLGILLVFLILIIILKLRNNI